MARAKRHYIPGQIWHITHRCHKREFLFKFAKDRRRWLQWLYQARKRYELTVLNYTVTSNHIHMLVMDNNLRDVIPRSMQLIAGRSGQEYNQRKKRKGAYWEDRYHATAIETDQHFMRCLVYIDLNMVRAGVVNHPSEWMFGGYNEIQRPRRKCVLIAYQKLAELSGFDSYDRFRVTHKEWVEELLKDGINSRQGEWTESIAVGSKSFVEEIKEKLNVRAKGRNAIEAGRAFQLREPVSRYKTVLGIKKEDIGHENSYSWDINSVFSRG